MLVSKVQLTALLEIKTTGQTSAASELVGWLVGAGLIVNDLVGLVVTQAGDAAISQTQDWQTRMARDHADTVYARWLQGEYGHG